MTLITFASWEERFLHRFSDNLKQRPVTHAIIYYLEEFGAWSKGNRDEAHRCAESCRVVTSEIGLSVNSPAANWLKLREELPNRDVYRKGALVDLTTMPREFIWTIFWFLQYVGSEIEFVYSKPETYNEEWLSRDPGRPRLIYKMSGIADPAKKVCLIVLGGFDVDRIKQLVNFYEPTETFIGLQKGEAGSVNNAKMSVIVRQFEGESDKCCFEVDAYADDQGETDILQQIGSYFDSHNVIMSSLGPKLSAVALYRIQRRYPQGALAYAPSREFNRAYSVGIGATMWGKLTRIQGTEHCAGSAVET